MIGAHSEVMTVTATELAKRYTSEAVFREAHERAKLVAALPRSRLPRLVRAVDAERTLVFEHAGEPLAHWAARVKPGARELAAILGDYAASLAALHASEQVHGDIRKGKLRVRTGSGAPAGVLVDRGCAPLPSPWSAPDVTRGAAPSPIDDVFALAAAFADAAGAGRPDPADGCWAGAATSGRTRALLAALPDPLRSVLEQATSFQIRCGDELVLRIEEALARGDTLRPAPPGAARASRGVPVGWLGAGLFGLGLMAGLYVGCSEPPPLAGLAVPTLSLPPPAPPPLESVAVATGERDPRAVSLDRGDVCWIDERFAGEAPGADVRCAPAGQPARDVAVGAAATHLLVEAGRVLFLSPGISDSVQLREAPVDGGRPPTVLLEVAGARARGLGATAAGIAFALDYRIFSITGASLFDPAPGNTIDAFTAAPWGYVCAECGAAGAQLVAVHASGERRRSPTPSCASVLAAAPDGDVFAVVVGSDGLERVLRWAEGREPEEIATLGRVTSATFAGDRLFLLGDAGAPITVDRRGARWRRPSHADAFGETLAIAARGTAGRDGEIWIVHTTPAAPAPRP